MDQPATKAHLARLAHSAFQAEVVALGKDLERFMGQAQSMTQRGKPGTIKAESMASRLEEYAAVRAQVAFYRDALGMRDAEILHGLEGLEATARTLLASATPQGDEDALAGTEAAAGLSAGAAVAALSAWPCAPDDRMSRRCGSARFRTMPFHSPPSDLCRVPLSGADSPARRDQQQRCER